jgi:peptide/nickel transport system permease protein
MLTATLVRDAEATPELVSAVDAKFMEEFGLGLPVWEQFWRFVTSLLRGDLGTSITFFPRSVVDIISDFLPWTVALLLPALITSWVLGNYLGALAAYKRKTYIDSVATPVFLVIAQIPLFWFAMLMLFVFAVHLGLFPIGGAHSWYLRPALSQAFVIDYLRHFALPFFTLVFGSMGLWGMGMRSMLIYELGQDYIYFGETLGLPDRKLRAYAFRSAMLPQITGLAIGFGVLLAGSLLIELVFNYRGMGVILFGSLTRLDYPMIQGVFIILAAMMILANLIVDVAYGFIDPRIKTVSKA